MQFTLLTTTLLASLSPVLAQGPGNRPGLCYPSTCGYELVNRGTHTQSDIAMMKCGRTDTCGGQEWNTIFSMGLSGTWSAMNFCSTGCYIEKKGICQLGKCH
ncbi:hypothetical protein ACJQWK_07943 [Exserohilum turcicum]|uniref:Uncharacterized protein n=1 Tax=Exserohilum turcicum (strain 28A) TaxID=671987 RepID=R0KBF7_EXST2|nr:uncharacterized protein SETTUDRAFT_36911 [Exserohilum turcica Et28A]EOA90263.1 hypothetical protein SETTUDRAFT_36911 [Exserohilum turcica Et28A]